MPGSVVLTSLGTGLSEHARAPFQWGAPGTKRQLRLTADGPGVSVAVDGITLIFATIMIPDLDANTCVGLFTRKSDPNNSSTFDNFQVSPS